MASRSPLFIASIGLAAALAGLTKYSFAWEEEDAYSARISDAPATASVRAESLEPMGEISAEGDGQASTQLRWGKESSFSALTSVASVLGKSLDDTGAGPKKGFWNLAFNTPKLSGMPKVNGKISIGGFDWDTTDGFGDGKHRLVQVGAKGKLKGLSYGANYKSIGSEFYELKKNRLAKDAGRRKMDLWVKKSMGRFFVKPFVRRSQTNVHENPDKPVMTDQLVGVSVGYTLMNWPYVGTSVSYASGTRESSLEPAGFDDLSVGITPVATALSVSHSTWNANLSIDRTTTSMDAETTHGEPAVTTYLLGGSYYPSSAFSIAPTASYSEEDYGQYDARTGILSTSLSLSFQPEGHNYGCTTYASYDTTKNAERWMDSKYFYSEAGIQWRLNKSSSANDLLSLTLAYDRYEDGFYSDSNTSDLSIHLTFRSFSPADIFSRGRLHP